MVEVAQRFLQVATHARVRPDEAVGAGGRVDHRPHVAVVGMEDHAGTNLVLAHQGLKPVAVERDVEHREVPHVHVRVEDHGSRPAACWLAARSGRVGCKLLTIN